MEAGYVVFTRNPSNGELLIMTNDDDNPCDFASHEDAQCEADANEAFKAWGYLIVKVEI